ncbi:PRC-barrel domain-containing protein [Paracoccus isoporae]|nr:PRC-barrel domain-containing protein [Paracoccus isoporae]
MDILPLGHGAAICAALSRRRLRGAGGQIARLRIACPNLPIQHQQTKVKNGNRNCLVRIGCVMRMPVGIRETLRRYQMRKFLLTTALVLPLSGMAFAQDADTAAEDTMEDAAQATENAAESAADAAGDAADAAGDAASDAADATTDAAGDAADAAGDAAADAGDAAEDAGDAAADAADAETETMDADATMEADSDMAAETEMEGDAAMEADPAMEGDAAADPGASAESMDAEAAAEDAEAAAMEAEMANSDKIAREQSGNELRVDWITGASVTSPDGDSIGDVNDIIVDSESGSMIAAIVGVGGFLGIGEKQIALPWDQLTINYDAEEITSELTQEEADAAPEYVFRERESAPAPAGATDGMATDPAADPAMAPADPAAAPADPAAADPAAEPAAPAN